MKIFKNALLPALALSLCALLAGCGGAPPRENGGAKKESAALTIGLMPDIDSVPFIIAREKGFFEEEKASVRLEQFKSAMDRDAALQSGQLDGAVSDLLAAAFAKAGGFDVRVTSSTDGAYQMIARCRARKSPSPATRSSSM